MERPTSLSNNDSSMQLHIFTLELEGMNQHLALQWLCLFLVERAESWRVILLAGFGRHRCQAVIQCEPGEALVCHSPCWVRSLAVSLFFVRVLLAHAPVVIIAYSLNAKRGRKWVLVVWVCGELLQAPLSSRLHELFRSIRAAYQVRVSSCRMTK
jgi:hypothetical protein